MRLAGRLPERKVILRDRDGALVVRAGFTERRGGSAVDDFLRGAHDGARGFDGFGGAGVRTAAAADAAERGSGGEVGFEAC